MQPEAQCSVRYLASLLIGALRHHGVNCLGSVTVASFLPAPSGNKFVVLAATIIPLLASGALEGAQWSLSVDGVTADIGHSVRAGILRLGWTLLQLREEENGRNSADCAVNVVLTLADEIGTQVSGCPWG
jgi:hypothetical protein